MPMTNVFIFAKYLFHLESLLIFLKEYKLKKTLFSSHIFTCVIVEKKNPLLLREMLGNAFDKT